MNKFIYKKLVIAIALILTFAGAGTASASDVDFFGKKDKGFAREIFDAKEERDSFLQGAKSHWGANAINTKNDGWKFKGLIQEFKGWFRSRLTWWY